MTQIVGIIDYGVAGNIRSIKKTLEKSGGKVEVVNSKQALDSVDKIVIPGVGSFSHAMAELRKSDLVASLQNAVNSKPILGICLGMQIMAKIGFEYGKTSGLGIIDAEVKPVLVNAKVPHMGFSQIEVLKKNALLQGVEDGEFYFMHSYEMVNYTNVIALSCYAEHRFVASVQKNNAYGVQFHPEKSREAGIQVFKNFIDI